MKLTYLHKIKMKELRKRNPLGLSLMSKNKCNCNLDSYPNHSTEISLQYQIFNQKEMQQIKSFNPIKKLILILVLIFTLMQTAFSQTFTEQTGISLIGVDYGSVAWGDYDNDGDLDILMSGLNNQILWTMYSGIYKNNGNNTFTHKTTFPYSVMRSSLTWGDYNSDGYMDVLLTGYLGNNRNISRIYRNNYGYDFAEQTDISPLAVDLSAVAWGDYDNDGDQDILLTGLVSGNTYISKIYRNNNGFNFSEQSGISLTGVIDGSVAWGDYDNDGDLDILLTGFSVSGPISKIYKNNGNNTFSEQTDISLTKVVNGSVAWGDYDSDGALDILITGDTDSYSNKPTSKIYKNNGNNTFSEQTEILLPGVYGSSVAWGDYDNDGDLDILLTGFTGSKRISKIFKNNGNNSFTEQIGISLPGVYESYVAWGDYDNDGDLDILLTGDNDAKGPITKIFRNEISKPNTRPSPPSNLKSVINGNSVKLTWDKSTDKETPANGLTYNIYFESSIKVSFSLQSPLSNIYNGFRKVVEIGNANLNNSWTFNNIPEGIYTWSVQAIDNNYTGSEFAPSGSFTIGNPVIPLGKPGTPTGITQLRINSPNTVYSTSGVESAEFYFWNIYPYDAGSISGSSTTATVNWSNTFCGTAYIWVTGKKNNKFGLKSDVLTVTFTTDIDSAGIITGETTVCQGSSKQIYTVPTIQGAVTYIWTLPSGATVKSTTNNISVSYSTTDVSGNIKVKGTNDFSEGAESTLEIKVNNLPLTAGTITGPTTVCQNSSNHIYTVTSIEGATSYEWTLPSGATGTSTTNSIKVSFDTTAISGNIKVKGKNNCGYGTESILAITVNAKPSKPVVTKNGKELLSSTATGNQWYKQNVLIPGATNQQYTSTGDGNYYVIRSQNNCYSEPSDIFIITWILAANSNRSIYIYPNPVIDKLIIQIEGDFNDTSFEIINQIGEVVLNGNFIEKTVVETSSLAHGIYYIKVENKIGSEVRKFLME